MQQAAGTPRFHLRRETPRAPTGPLNGALSARGPPAVLERNRNGLDMVEFKSIPMCQIHGTERRAEEISTGILS